MTRREQRGILSPAPPPRKARAVDCQVFVSQTVNQTAGSPRGVAQKVAVTNPEWGYEDRPSSSVSLGASFITYPQSDFNTDLEIYFTRACLAEIERDRAPSLQECPYRRVDTQRTHELFCDGRGTVRHRGARVEIQDSAATSR